MPSLAMFRGSGPGSAQVPDGALTDSRPNPSLLSLWIDGVPVGELADPCEKPGRLMAVAVELAAGDPPPGVRPIAMDAAHCTANLAIDSDVEVADAFESRWEAATGLAHDPYRDLVNCIDFLPTGHHHRMGTPAWRTE